MRAYCRGGERRTQAHFEGMSGTVPGCEPCERGERRTLWRGGNKESQISGSNVNRRESDALSEYDGSIDFILSLDA